MKIKKPIALCITIILTVISHQSASAFSFSEMLLKTFAYDENLVSETFCFDNKDNDKDGFYDCQDIDCYSQGYCTPLEVDCTDKKDNDGDGEIDCRDDNCKHSQACTDNKKIEQLRHSSAEQQNEICDNGFDDNNNGIVDCAEHTCLSSTLCNSNINTELFCDDGIDNNQNGKIDCEEESCQSQKNNKCEKNVETSCNDNIDNDGDGQVDCSDKNCRHKTTCGVEVCNDNIDNDGDGQIDCLDIECELACQIEVCYDGIDNDLDGGVDCLDVDCHGSPNPQGSCEYGFETQCDDNMDNDMDNKTDCEDIDCSQSAYCMSTCGNGIVEAGEECDSAEGCVLCEIEKPNCEITIAHKKNQIIIQNPHEWINTQRLSINGTLIANLFTQTKFEIHNIGTQKIFWQAHNAQGLIQCEKEIIINAISGCADEKASNFNPTATHHDGSCIYEKKQGSDCEILSPQKTQTNGNIIYSREKRLQDNFTTHRAYITSKSKRIPISLSGGEITTTIDDQTTQETKLLQIIKNDGSILSCLFE